MSTKTHVVEIKELYSLIPECRSLEHKNFTNVKELLTTLIRTVETSEQWEFVQYISNKPSLFIVRLREVEQVNTFNRRERTQSIPVYKEPTMVPQSNKSVEVEIPGLEKTPKTDKLPWE